MLLVAVAVVSEVVDAEVVDVRLYVEEVEIVELVLVGVSEAVEVVVKVLVLDDVDVEVVLCTSTR